MLVNLPSSLSREMTQMFGFGDVEALSDKFLEYEDCVCVTDGMGRFLANEKNIAVGDRGSGKTAMFRLMHEGRLAPKNIRSSNNIFVTINDEYNYSTIKQKVLPLVETNVAEASFKYQVIWEVFILYKILERLREERDICNDILPLIKKFNKFFGFDNTKSIVGAISSIRGTLGCKLYSQPGSDMLLPDFYIKPSQEQISEEAKHLVQINITEYKTKINDILKSKKTSVYILVDKLDEFVVEEEYSVQKLLLQGLLGVVSTYTTFIKIVLKIFLRRDLFIRLDYSKLGHMKIKARTVALDWSDQDIFKLTGERIAANYNKVLGLDKLKIRIDEDKKYFVRFSNDASYAYKWKCKILSYFRRIFNRNGEGYKEELTTKTEEIYKMFITSIFPGKVTHKTAKGEDETIDICTFFSTHFKTGSGSINPRLVVMFMNYCREITCKRLEDDLVREVPLNKYGEYELITRNDMRKAYVKIQQDAWEEVSQTDPKWRPYVNKLQKNKQQGIMDYKFIKRSLGAKDEELLNSFLAFCSHVGVLVNVAAEDIPHKERKYELPVVFKQAFPV